MNGILLEIPEKILATAEIRRAQLELELVRRLVAAMYADGVAGGSSACMLAGVEKTAFQHWNGEHPVIRPLCGDDYRLERRNLEEWLSGD